VTHRLILGVRIDATSYADATDRILAWARRGESRYVCLGAVNNVIGRAIVVHRDKDDFTTQPAGNSGPRVGCAVIRRG